MIKKLKEKVLAGEQITYEEALSLSQVENKEALYKAANEIREKLCGTNMDLCSITNAKSGACPQDCKWCTQSMHHKTDVEVYDVADKKQVVKEAMYNAERGVKRHSLVTSGRKASNKTLDNLIPIYKEIQEKTEIKVCASMGLLDEAQLVRLKEEVDIDHYHCNLETAPSYFPKMVTTHRIEDKIQTIKKAKNLGIKVCSGGILGMGETQEQRIELAFALKELEVDSIPINLLMPMKGTPLEDVKPLTEEEILMAIALFRFINPTAKLRFAGGRMQIKAFENKALKAGINAALTGDYLTSTGSNVEEDIVNFKKAGFSI